MSIDARISGIYILADGTGHLDLIDRPPSRPGDTGGIAGQTTLHFSNAPFTIALLVGEDIWGGDDDIMAGEERVARRDGYGEIRFTDHYVARCGGPMKLKGVIK